MTPALTSQPADGRVVVIGLGADGWTGLPVPVQRRLTDASVVLGSERQLALLPLLALFKKRGHASQHLRLRDPLRRRSTKLRQFRAQPTFELRQFGT